MNWRILSIGLTSVLILTTSPLLLADGDETGIAHRVAALEAQVAVLMDLLQYVSVQQGEIDGLAGPHFIIEGANVHIRSGSGRTLDACASSAPPYDCLSGLGNLTVGYNEAYFFDPCTGEDCPTRTGSHNIITGTLQSFEAHSGLVVGSANKALAAYEFVAGWRNTASGVLSSVIGGSENTASGLAASVSGGDSNTASGDYASVSGGGLNTASGHWAFVSGGYRNEASGLFASASGGEYNTASGIVASVIGGEYNTASDLGASVSGGSYRTADVAYCVLGDSLTFCSE
jgi:hypothetical protein